MTIYNQLLLLIIVHLSVYLSIYRTCVSVCRYIVYLRINVFIQLRVSTVKSSSKANVSFWWWPKLPASWHVSVIHAMESASTAWTRPSSITKWMSEQIVPEWGIWGPQRAGLSTVTIQREGTIQHPPPPLPLPMSTSQHFTELSSLFSTCYLVTFTIILFQRRVFHSVKVLRIHERHLTNIAERSGSRPPGEKIKHALKKESIPSKSHRQEIYINHMSGWMALICSPFF